MKSQNEIAFDFVNQTKKNIFLTGRAGTGKTTFLHNLKKNTFKRMIVVAPTGVAAINAGGVTIHSFFQIPPRMLLPNELGHLNSSSDEQLLNTYRFSKDKLNIIRTLDLLVVDEISMVRCDLLDAMDSVLRYIRRSDEAFGGVQLLMIGDLHQLPPVVKDDEWILMQQYYRSPYFFDSLVWEKTSYICIEFKEIFRQKDLDFINILNNIREGKMEQSILDKINERYNPYLTEEETEGYIILTTHNYQAQRINEKKLTENPNKVYTYKALVTGDFPEYAYPNDFELKLKVGAQVMFIRNDISFEKLFYNGKIGYVSEIDDDSIWVKCYEDNTEINVRPMEWNNIRYALHPETQEIIEEKLGAFVQYPLKLAWAITIHKSQGLTFEKAIIDARQSFAHGQVYVALSRCRSLEGLILNSQIAPQSVIVDSVVNQLSKELGDKEPDANSFNEAKNEYAKELINELFDFSVLGKNLYYINKIIYENSHSLADNVLPSLVQDVINYADKNIITISEKFKIQLNNMLINSNYNINANIQDRIKKACDYFSKQLENQIFSRIFSSNIHTDNKKFKQSLSTTISNLYKVYYEKRMCLNSCINEFDIGIYLKAKAKSRLYTEKYSVGKTTETKKEYITHPLLFHKLMEWRKNLSIERNMSEHNILKQKNILDIIQKLPTSVSELAEIDGITNQKIKKYGKDLLEIIHKYIKESNIDKPIDSTSIEEQIFEKTADTKYKTFVLYKEGKKIEDIAKIRKLSIDTIYGHLAHYIKNGEIEIYDIVKDKNKVDVLTNHFIDSHNYSFKYAKECLGDEFSYGEIKLVFSHLVFEGIIEDENEK